MKKIFTLLVASLLSLNLLQAQEAFRHLGASLEVGTTGIGVNISYPLITDRLVLTVGYNFPSFQIGTDFKLNSGAISNQMKSAVGKIENYNRYIDQNQLVASQLNLNKISTDNLQKSIGEIDTDINAKLNFGNIKALFEYYPTKQSYFHFTAGFFYGNGNWMDISGTADRKVWSAYQDVVNAHDQLQRIVSNYPQLQGEITTLPSVNEAAKVTVYNETFAVDPQTGKLDVSLSIRKLKTYLGIGFGSSVPTKRNLGFQLEIGAYYQGKPTLESKAKVAYDGNAYNSKTVDDIVETLEYLNWYPQLTFRFTGKIF